MNQGGSGFFCGLSLGLRQTWRLKECKRQTSPLVEREALATPVKTCSFRTKRNRTETGDDTTLQHRVQGHVLEARAGCWLAPHSANLPCSLGIATNLLCDLEQVTFILGA